MQIDYRQGKGLALYFPPNELKVALGILKAIYSVSKLEFVAEAIKDLEDDLLPRKIPFINHFHLCEKCFMMVDDREENVVHLNGTVNRWKHRVCKDLKTNRPN